MKLSQRLIVHSGLCLTGIIGLVIIWFDTFNHLASIVWSVDGYSHGLWVPFISLGLIWNKRDQTLLPAPSFSWLGIPVIAIASVLWLIGAAAEIKLIQHFAFILGIQSVLLSCLGKALYRAYLFPFLFLFLAIPFGEGLIPILQTITAETVIFLLEIAGVSIQVEGVLLTLSSGTYEVARACAGIKFFFTSMVVGVLLAHLLYRKWIHRLALLLAAALLPIIANALRVLGILVIAESTDPSFAKGIDHLVYGWGFLSLVLIVLITIAYKFSDKTVSETDASNTKAAYINTQHPQWVSMLLFSMIMALPIVALKLAPDKAQQLEIPYSFIPPECSDCGYRLLKSNPDKVVSSWRAADSSFEVSYRSAAEVLTVSGALYCPQRPGSKLIQYGNLPAGVGWERLPGLGQPIIITGGWKLQKQTYWKGNQRRIVFVGYFLNNKKTVSEQDVKIQTAIERLVTGQSAGAVYAIIVSGSSSFAQGTEKIENFLSTFTQDQFLWNSLKPSSEGHNLCVA